jgi:hypothetical protein
LKVRETYGFEYVRDEDPSRMVSMRELMEDEVLERLRKILKGVSIVSHRVDEHTAASPPPTISVLYIHCFFIFFA